MDFQYYLTQIDGLYLLIFSILIGLEVVKNVPAILHTPLMSGSNAISGIIVLAATIQLLNTPSTNYLHIAIAGIAVFLGVLNIAGGFFITNRMLSMFKSKKN